MLTIPLLFRLYFAAQAKAPVASKRRGRGVSGRQAVTTELSAAGGPGGGACGICGFAGTSSGWGSVRNSRILNIQSLDL